MHPRYAHAPMLCACTHTHTQTHTHTHTLTHTHTHTHIHIHTLTLTQTHTHIHKQAVASCLPSLAPKTAWIRGIDPAKATTTAGHMRGFAVLKHYNWCPI